MPRIVLVGAPMGSYTLSPTPRPYLGIIPHHTAGPTDPAPKWGASWHYLIQRNEDAEGYAGILAVVPETGLAHHAGSTDKWRPPWVQNAPGGIVSAANWSALGIEIVYAPQAPHNQIPTPAQHRSLKWLIGDLYRRHGRLPVVGHGQIDSQKWPTEPHGLRWEEVGLTRKDANGRWLADEQGAEMTEEERAIIEVMRGLNANASSIHGWINEIGVHKATIIEQAQRIAQLEASAPPPGDIPVPLRVEVFHQGGRVDGFIPES